MSTTLVCKVSFGSNLTRRVSFNSYAQLDYDHFKAKIARCFSLHVSSFRIAYEVPPRAVAPDELSSRASSSSSSGGHSKAPSIPLSNPPTYKSRASNSGSSSAGDAPEAGPSTLAPENLGREELSSRWFRELTPSPSPSASNPNNSFPDLPTLLADLSLSRITPAPSLHSLSSVPDELLRCSDCRKPMRELRYICTLCGPILPEGRRRLMRLDEGAEDVDLDFDETGSDAGTVMESEGESEVGLAGGNGEEIPLMRFSKVEKGKGREDALERARNVALPLSPETSRAGSGSSGNGSGGATGTNGHAHTGNGALDDHSDHFHQEEELGGYELCPECVETAGVRHAAEMAVVARRREEGEGLTEGREVGHSFAEVMRMPKSSLLGWREVDYEDDVHCTICGDGPVQTNRFKCLSCPKFELCLSCYRTVEDIHPIHAFLAVPDRPARPVLDTPSPPASVTSGSGHATAEDVRLAVLRARGVVGSNGERRVASEYSGWSGSSEGGPNRAPRVPPKPVKHPGVLCFGCLGDIVGPRYSCASCASFDLCKKCESLEPPITSPDGRHDHTHILLKITVPVSEDIMDDASDRARVMTRDGSSLRQRRSSPGRRSIPQWEAPPYENHGIPPPSNYPAYSQPQYPNQFPVQPLAHPGSRDEMNNSFHNIVCQGCSRLIQGVRWICAQCGSTPTYDLCSSCEQSSHLIHNPLHCFLRITRPLQHALPPLSQLLPILYDPSAPARFESLTSNGSSRSGSSEGLNDAVVLHQNVICDNCLEAIPGAWMRCCHCANSFDLCVECLNLIEHDPYHVFAKFTRRIDMSLFRELTKISSQHPQPLLTFGVYS
ncbi:hypothetical protein MNV49_006967 [Pseudohyphozyma bogoriensis]|nr:hypothetical protein MNV49_006967 [Pseudohyphozyma bogoriensis]